MIQIYRFKIILTYFCCYFFIKKKQVKVLSRCRRICNVHIDVITIRFILLTISELQKSFNSARTVFRTSAIVTVRNHQIVPPKWSTSLAQLYSYRIHIPALLLLIECCWPTLVFLFDPQPWSSVKSVCLKLSMIFEYL